LNSIAFSGEVEFRFATQVGFSRLGRYDEAISGKPEIGENASMQRIVMDNVGRLLLRFILIPVGYFAAAVAGTLVIVLGSWKLGPVAVTSDPDAQAVAVFGFVFAAPILLVLLLSTMWLPASIGVLISEAFAIRAWMFHAANGAVSAWIAWSMFGYIDDTRIPINQPVAIIAAGLAGGFAYWAIAGWSAGFWKPVFRGPRAVPLPAPPERFPAKWTSGS
jgi:hypothetical protein